MNIDMMVLRHVWKRFNVFDILCRVVWIITLQWEWFRLLNFKVSHFFLCTLISGLNSNRTLDEPRALSVYFWTAQGDTERLRMRPCKLSSEDIYWNCALWNFQGLSETLQYSDQAPLNFGELNKGYRDSNHATGSEGLISAWKTPNKFSGSSNVLLRDIYTDSEPFEASKGLWWKRSTPVEPLWRLRGFSMRHKDSNQPLRSLERINTRAKAASMIYSEAGIQAFTKGWLQGNWTPRYWLPRMTVFQAAMMETQSLYYPCGSLRGFSQNQTSPLNPQKPYQGKLRPCPSPSTAHKAP